MMIRNFDQLATSPLRKVTLDMLEAGLAALQTQDIIRRSVTLDGSKMKVKEHTIDLSSYSNIFVVGIGKAAVSMGTTIEEILGEYVTAGYILDRKPGKFRKLQSLIATHPDPSEGNVKQTEKIIEFLKKADEHTFILVLISGGGSAMLASPYRMSVSQKSAIARKLMDGGATINELNVVRKHLSRIKGGRLVEIVYPAKVVSLILSDVPGDDLATIASGPTVFDPTTIHEAKAILKKYGIDQTIEFSESPKDPNLFEHVENIILGNVQLAIGPMQEKAKVHGFETRILSSSLTGDADKIGHDMLKKVGPGEALIAAGETTINVRGHGVGGRNQQLVLSALGKIKDNQLITSIGTDGHDNSDAAGAIGDVETVEKAKKMHLDPGEFAKNNDSFTFFKTVGDGVMTGDLESNFADLMLCLWEKS